MRNMEHKEQAMKLRKIDHIGIRVMAFARAVAFYRQLGFEMIREDLDERVVVLRHPSGITINLLDSAVENLEQRNILMDVIEKYPGYTHYALAVDSITETQAEIERLGIPITEGPVTFGNGYTSIFIRDLDRNVIEFTQPADT